MEEARARKRSTRMSGGCKRRQPHIHISPPADNPARAPLAVSPHNGLIDPASGEVDQGTSA